jgi:hypothetical protein
MYLDSCSVIDPNSVYCVETDYVFFGTSSADVEEFTFTNSPISPPYTFVFTTTISSSTTINPGASIPSNARATTTTITTTKLVPIGPVIGGVIAGFVILFTMAAFLLYRRHTKNMHPAENPPPPILPARYQEDANLYPMAERNPFDPTQLIFTPLGVEMIYAGLRSPGTLHDGPSNNQPHPPSVPRTHDRDSRSQQGTTSRTVPGSHPIPSTTHFSTSPTQDLPLLPFVPTARDDSNMRSLLEALRAEVAQLREHPPVTPPQTPGWFGPGTAGGAAARGEGVDG